MLDGDAEANERGQTVAEYAVYSELTEHYEDGIDVDDRVAPDR